MTATAREPRQHPERAILGAILLIGFLLRLPGLWQFDAWQDEIYSIFEARDLIHSPFGPGGMELRPLYFLALHPLAKAMPHAMLLMRLPSFIFGMLGMLATWSLTRRVLGLGAAIVATGVLAVLPLHINASQIIRYWSLIYLLGALFAGAILRALEGDARRDHLLALTWLLLGTLTHPTFAITALGMTVAAHLVHDDGRLGFRAPTAGAWRFTWIPAVVILLGYYGILWIFFTTERLVGEAAGSPERLLPAIAFNLSPAVVTAAALGILWLLRSKTATWRRFGLMAVIGSLTSAVTLLIGGLLHFLPVSVLYISAAFPLLLGCAGALCTALRLNPVGEERAGYALALILAAALSPSTVSQLQDGSRFDYRPALAHITANDPHGTVVLWPRVQAMWGTPDLESIELRSDTPIATFDSLSHARTRFWVITSERRYGFIGDVDGRKQKWLHRNCDLVLTTGRPRYDFEQYIAMLWECHERGPQPIGESAPGAASPSDRD